MQEKEGVATTASAAPKVILTTVTDGKNLKVVIVTPKNLK